MGHLREWLTRFLGLFRKRGVDSEELQEEIRFHLEMETEENLRRGMNPQEAERRARIRLGGVAQVKQAYDEQRGLPVVEALVKDVRYGLRMLRRSPGFTAVAVLSLGFGIGASSSVFSVVDAVLIQKLPVKEPGRLVFLGSHRRGLRVDDVPTAELFSYSRYQDLRSATDAFDGLAAFGSFDWRVYVREHGDGGAGTSLDPATARLVSGGYFEVLGLRPWLGRLLGPGDDRNPGGHPVTALSHGYWKRRFGSDPNAIGKSILINGEPFTIVGVTPPEFLGETVGSSTDFWIPLAMQRTMRREAFLLDDRDTSFLLLVGRLKKGVSLARAETEATAAFRRILASEMGEAPETMRRVVDRIRVEVIPGERGLSGFRRRYGDALLLLMALILLVLLIACANIANLLLARAETRRNEMNVRVSLGAGRARLMRQLLTESLVLGLAGGVLGIVLARWGSQVLLAMASAGPRVVPIDISLDHRVLGFTLVVCVLTAAVFGLVPALRATRADGITPLSSHSPRVIGSGFGLSKALVVSQVALSLLLLASAALFLRSLESLREAELGFGPEDLMVVEIDPAGGGLTREEATTLYPRIQERMEAIAGVKSAALSLRPLLSGSRRREGIEVDGYTFQEGESDAVYMAPVLAGYFRTVRMKLLEGRPFDATDRDSARPVAIVNKAFHQRFLSDRHALGARIRISAGEDDLVEREIVGVVGDARYYRVREEPPEMVFVPALQAREYLESVDILTETGIALSAGEIRRILAELEPRLPVRRVSTLTERVEGNLAQEAMLARLTGFFGVFAVLLASIGLYGVMSYVVSRRTNEIGIRLALGADRGQVVRRVLGESLLLLAVGSVIGVAAALAAGQWIESLLYGTRATDPGILSLAVGVLAVVTLTAAYVPARRASRIDPSAALRYE